MELLPYLWGKDGRGKIIKLMTLILLLTFAAFYDIIYIEKQKEEFKNGIG